MLMRPWACVINSFAFAARINVEFLIKDVGHDGSEIIFPYQTEPYCRRGFSVDEITKVLFRNFHYAVVTISRDAYVHNSFSNKPVFVDHSIDTKEFLSEHRFCLSNATHMIGCRRDLESPNLLRVYDSTGKVTKVEDFDWDLIYLIKRVIQ